MEQTVQRNRKRGGKDRHGTSRVAARAIAVLAQSSQTPRRNPAWSSRTLPSRCNRKQKPSAVPGTPKSQSPTAPFSQALRPHHNNERILQRSSAPSSFHYPSNYDPQSQTRFA